MMRMKMKMKRRKKKEEGKKSKWHGYKSHFVLSVYVTR